MEEFRHPSDSEAQAHITSNVKSHLTNNTVLIETERESSFSNGKVHDGEVFGPQTEQKALPTDAHTGTCRKRLFMLTASDKDCVKTQSLDLSQYLRTKLNAEESFLANLAFTLANRRSILDWRLITSASSVQELLAKLENSDVHLNRASKAPGLGFVFTGQGAQWPTMGQQLLVHPKFASTMRQADEYLRSFGAGWSLLGET